MFAAACIDGEDKTDKQIDKEIDSITNAQNKIDENVGESVIYTKYNLPLPVDLYRYMKKHKSQFDPDLLNSTDNVNRYNTSISKAFNLGIYSSALAYCTVFEQNQQALNYFVTTKKLSDDLHIDNGYDQTIIERGNANIDNSDSLNKLATAAYWQACRFLEENNKVNILPFVIVGSWLESMYLAINTVDISEEGREIMIHIAHQKKALENLTQYLLDVMVDSNAFEANKEIQKMLNQLKEIKAIYAQMEQNPEGVEITDEQFQQIKEEVEEIRNYYVN